MKVGVGVLLICVSLVSSEYIHATILPDACGKDSQKFSVKRQKGAATPVDPKPGEAQLVFIGTIDKKDAGFCFGCDVTTRIGVDGAWAGADKGDSYFVFNVPAGEHHLCADWQLRFHSADETAAVASVNTEPGRVYYFEAKTLLKLRDVGLMAPEQIDRLSLKQLSEDEGKYAMKISALSRSKPKK